MSTDGDIIFILVVYGIICVFLGYVIGLEQMRAIDTSNEFEVRQEVRFQEPMAKFNCEVIYE